MKPLFQPQNWALWNEEAQEFLTCTFLTEEIAQAFAQEHVPSGRVVYVGTPEYLELIRRSRS